VATAFDAVDTVRSVLAILERQLVVVSLLRDVLDQGLSVAIGAEHGYESLASCAVVVAPLTVGDQEAGAIGLLGPTRMNYPQAMAAAHVVGERLGQRLGNALGAAGPDEDPPRRAGGGGGRGRG
jgi:heat-inducible transcriptional repressor